LKIYAKKRKRNNVIDILKAGGTRISLFLSYKILLLIGGCQYIKRLSSLILRVIEGAGLSLSILNLRVFL
jgi:hypothetical protein